MGRLRTLAKSFKATWKRSKRGSTASTGDEKIITPNHPYAAGRRAAIIPFFEDSRQTTENEPYRPRSSGRSPSDSTTLASTHGGGERHGQDDPPGLQNDMGQHDGATASQTRTENESFTPLAGLATSSPTSADDISPLRPLLDRPDSGFYFSRRGTSPAPAQNSRANNTIAPLSLENEESERRGSDNGSTGSTVPKNLENGSADEHLSQAVYSSQPFYNQYDQIRLLLSRREYPT